MIILCEYCKKIHAPLKWFKEVEKVKKRIEAIGGVVHRARYVCPDCAQLLFRAALGQNYMQSSTVN